MALAGLTAGRAHAASTVSGITQQSTRQFTATLSSSSLSLLTPQVSALLPTSYWSTSKRYPVVYLLHGSYGSHADFISQSPITSLSASQDVIVVMPDGGSGGWYNNHLHITNGTMNWLDFHLNELVPAVDATLRTIPQASGRAIAGISMGGYGALHYATRRPDLFSAVSSYSGACDPTVSPFPDQIYNGPARDGENAGAVFGARGSEQASEWGPSDPALHAGNLAGMRRVALYNGTGSGEEASIRAASDSMHAALTTAGVEHVHRTVDGGHDWTTFSTELSQDFSDLVGALEQAS